MTKDSVNSPIKPPGRRAIAYAYATSFTKANALVYANANALALANANTNPLANANATAISLAISLVNANANTNANANAYVYAEFITSLITLAELFQQDQIFSTVNYQPFSTKLREEQDFFRTKPQLTREEFEERINAIFQVWNQTFSLFHDTSNKLNIPFLLHLQIVNLVEVRGYNYYTF
jgi:hypothetical protein